MPMPKEQVFETLWARMAERGDFPTLQHSVRDIVHAMQAEDSTTAEMAEAVLSDFSLTQKVLRLANSPMYAPFGGEVSTISHAIMVLGAETIGYLALGLQLLESFSGLVAGTEAAAQELKQAQLAAEFARQVTAARGAKDSETTVVCALMYPLARLLVVFYFPDEWREIKGLNEHWILSESEACKQMLGVSFADIAKEVATRWGLPQGIAASMQPRPLDAASPPTTHADWLGAISQLASQAASRLTAGHSDEVQPFVLQFVETLGLDKESMRQGCQAMNKLKTQLDALPIMQVAQERTQGEASQPDAVALLHKGLAKVRSTAQTFSVAEMMPLVLEIMMQALGNTRCFAFLLYPSHKRFIAKVGFGPGVRENLAQLSFEEGFVPDVFHLACAQKKIIFIEDAGERHITQRLPSWYRSLYPGVRAFLLVPVTMRGRCIALLYGDWGEREHGGPAQNERLLLEQLSAEIAIVFERQVSSTRPRA